MFWSIAAIAAICECGERVTEQFHLYNDKLNRCKWYCLPLDLQRMLLIFMCDAQQPAFVQGFGSIICTRDAFKAVCGYDEKIHIYVLGAEQLCLSFFLDRQYCIFLFYDGSSNNEQIKRKLLMTDCQVNTFTFSNLIN